MTTDNPEWTQEQQALATFEGVQLAQLRDALQATPTQRMAWLEQAIEYAYRTGALKPRGPIEDWDAPTENR